ncbi:MAG: DUF192 domain-containing protein [Opitutales bacterium]|nr:DUF192 domain-containing protein [Opitutales bacterium]
MKLRHIFLVLLLTLAGCGGCSSAEGEAQVHRAGIEERLPLRIGNMEIAVQIAVTQREQARGLMFRKELADGDGMLFPYEAPQRMSFWMNNVPIGLDIGFFDSEGVLKEVRHMYPHDTRTVNSASDRIQYALEMSEGWFARAGVKSGDRLDLVLLCKALKARGEKPSSYGLAE